MFGLIPVAFSKCSFIGFRMFSLGTAPAPILSSWALEKFEKIKIVTRKINVSN